jgi:NADPH:quinone reductase
VKAALYERHGAAAEVLRGADIERPDPGPGEVRVRVEVSGVNPTDWKLRSGATPQAIDRFQIPHHDAAGVIDAVGAASARSASGSGSGPGWPRPGGGGERRQSGP